MRSRIPKLVVMAALAACGGNVDADGSGQSGGTGGTTANGGSGGGEPIGGSGGSSGMAGTGVGGAAGTAGVGGAAGTAGVGGTSGASGTAGAGGTTSTFCPLMVIERDTFDPSDGATSYDGPIAVPTPSGFILGYWRGAASGESEGVRLQISDLGIKSTQTIVPMAPCPGGAVSNGVGAAWNDSLGAGVMAVSMAPCAASDAPMMHVSNFDVQGTAIAEIEYQLPSDILLNPVKSMAPSPETEQILLAGMAGSVPFLYTFDGVAVQQDPPPTEIHEGTGTATFAQVATSPTTLAQLTDSDEAGGKLIISLQQGIAATSSTEMPPSSTTSLWTWNERGAVVSASGTALDWLVFNYDGELGAGALGSGPYGAVDMVKWGEELVMVGAKPGSVSLFRVAGVDGATPGPTEESLTTLIDGYEGTRIAITAARDSLVVAWLTSTEVLSSGESPGGYVVLGCGP